MAQVGWVYLDDFGNRNRIGIYHGDRTGHLVIHCNLRVVQVDFSVKESRTYSFFVEDELCEVSVVKEKNGFTYDFKVNKQIDTPRNRLRKAEERRNRKYMALFLGGMALVLVAAFIGFRQYGKMQRQKLLGATSLSSRLKPEYEARMAVEGKPAVAQLQVVEEGLKRRIYYGFLTDKDKHISGLFSVPDTGLIVLPNGFPLENRDAFQVRYLPLEPEIHLVDFFQPTDQTLAAYLQRALEAEQRAHPGATPGHSLCVAHLTLEKKGWQQLADLIFQSVPPEKNLDHNRDSYLRLVREAEFARVIARECWDK